MPIRNRLFIFLGTISYSLYLVPMLVASCAEFVLVRLFAPDTAPERFATQLVCLAATIAGAWIFYHLIERHFVVWWQRFSGRPVSATGYPLLRNVIAITLRVPSPRVRTCRIKLIGTV